MNTSLRSLFGPQNLSALRKNAFFTFIFYSDLESKDKLQEVIKGWGLKIGEYEIRFIYDDGFHVLEDKYSNKKYGRVTSAQNNAAGFAKKNNQIFVPLYADFIVPTDFFEKLIEKASSGVDIWLSLIPAVVTEPVVRWIFEKVFDDEDYRLTANDIRNFTRDHMHPLMTQSIFGYGDTFVPIGPFIGAGRKDCFVMKSIHFHPFFITPNLISGADYSGTIDESWIQSMVLHELNMEVNTDLALPVISLMDSDFPLPKDHGVSLDDHFTGILGRQISITACENFLTYSSVFDFREPSDQMYSNKVADLSLKLDRFADRVLSKVKGINAMSIKALKEPTEDIIVNQASFVKRTFHLPFKTKSILYLPFRIFPKRFRRFVFSLLSSRLQRILTLR